MVGRSVFSRRRAIADSGFKPGEQTRRRRSVPSGNRGTLPDQWKPVPLTSPTGVSASYDVDEDNDGRRFGVVYLAFDDLDTDACPAEALQAWVEALIDRFGDDAQDAFDRLDMRVFETARKKAPSKAGARARKRA